MPEPKIIELHFCTLTLHDVYIISEVKEGFNISPEINDIWLEIIEEHYVDKPFVYIAHRVHSYSVDPKIYFRSSKIKNLKGIAVVSEKYKSKTNAEIERMFFSKPFEIFGELDQATDWAKKIVTGS